MVLGFSMFCGAGVQSCPLCLLKHLGVQGSLITRRYSKGCKGCMRGLVGLYQNIAHLTLCLMVMMPALTLTSVPCDRIHL